MAADSSQLSVVEIVLLGIAGLVALGMLKLIVRDDDVEPAAPLLPPPGSQDRRTLIRGFVLFLLAAMAILVGWAAWVAYWG